MTTQMSVEEQAYALGIDPTKFTQQCELEMESYALGIDRYNNMKDKILLDKNKDNTLLKPEQALLQRSLKKVAAAIGIVSRRIDKSARDNVKAAKRFLQQIDPDRLAFLTLQFAFNIDPSRNTLTGSCIALGKRIEKDWEYFCFKETAPGYLTVVERNLKSAHQQHRHRVLTHAKNTVKIVDKETKEVIGVGIPDLNWTEEMRFAVGKLLLEQLTEHTELFEVATMAKRSLAKDYNMGECGQQVLIVQRTEVCRAVIEKNHNILSEMKPLVYPFVCRPRPWRGVYEGAFWTRLQQRRKNMIRTRNRRVLERASQHGVDTVNKALNAVGDSRYRINRRVLEVMEECARVGLGGLPAADRTRILVNDHYPLEEECPWTDAEIEVLKETKDEAWKRWNLDRSTAWDIWHRQNSQRLTLMWKLKIARKFLNEPEIFFAWNVDYRGREYCFQPYLNPQMDDSGRGLLEFAEGKALGEEGARWLQIHGANEFGYDKATLSERILWVQQHMNEILDSANNPLDGARFWCEADHPFQFLAFCFEYKGLVEQGFGYVSHLPVQVDGTCSGLQHYSALLGDSTGAAAVNLIPAGKKADVYAEVAREANVLLQQDLSKGGDEAKYAAAWLGIGVDRSIAKRNTMTFCYGATKQGFGQQLSDHAQKKGIKFPEGVDLYSACNYLGDINWRAVSAVLVKSVEAMGFLQKLAFFMGQNGMDIQWSTPLGLRVTQDYLKTKTKQIKTWWGGVRIDPTIQIEVDEKNPTGSRNGIAPNFIHSLDASHLMLTVLRCKEQGIDSFSLIHDSFGTHAADMETMNRVLRETFAEMYSENLLQKFVDDVRTQIPADKLADFEAIVSEHMPTRGSLDVRVVEKSLYFFS